MLAVTLFRVTAPRLASEQAKLPVPVPPIKEMADPIAKLLVRAVGTQFSVIREPNADVDNAKHTTAGSRAFKQSFVKIFLIL